MRINFNYEATSTHTAYLVNQREMGKSLLRLSTGMRILEASDDAAGLFIADQLSLVATGLEEGSQQCLDFLKGKALIGLISLSKLFAWLSVVQTSYLKPQKLLRWMNLGKEL